MYINHNVLCSICIGKYVPSVYLWSIVFTYDNHIPYGRYIINSSGQKKEIYCAFILFILLRAKVVIL